MNRPSFQTHNDALFDVLSPFIVAPATALTHLDPAPFGLVTRWHIDPLVAANGPFFELLQRLDQLTFGPEGMPMTPQAVDWARRHFIEHVRALGPLPALRVGRQPYGLLPVTLLGDWIPGADDGEGGAHALKLRDLLVLLRDRLWRPRLDGVPRMGRFGNTTAVFSMLRDKDVAGVAHALRGQVDRWYIAPSAAPRGIGTEGLRAALARAGAAGDVREFATVEQAWVHAREMAGPDDRIVAFGSFLTVGAVLAALARG
jgi:hypothetical protein